MCLIGYFELDKKKRKHPVFKEINAVVSQGSVPDSVLYLLCTSDIPQTCNTKTATFANDTDIFAIEKIIDEVTSEVQRTINSIHEWPQKSN